MERMKSTHYQSPLGYITLAGNEQGLAGLWFDGQKYFGATLSIDCTAGALPVFEEAKEWLDLYFEGEIPTFTPRLCLEGSDFRLAVWQRLLQIPYGKVCSYKELAEEMAHQRSIPRMSAQAVGGAVGHNPISLIIPCHRVIGSDGNLTGYAGGIERKEWLLSFEHQHFLA
jgi:methylated-DNA-[protein]-cysteine S-methyltransferase